MDVNGTIIPDLSECGQGPFLVTLALSPVPNLCVIWLILAGPRKIAMDISSLNQALCELAIFSVYAAWLILRNLVGIDALPQFYVVEFCYGLLFTGRPVFMSWVCLERYLAVVHPVTFLKYNSSKYRVAGAVVAWLMVSACCISIMWITYPAIYYVCFGLTSPWFVLQVYCSVEILRALVRPGPGDGNQERRTMNRAKLSAFRVVAIILMSEVFTYTPTVAAITLFSLNHLKDSTKIYCIANYCMVFTSIMPPLIFLNRARKYFCNGTT